MSTQNSGHPAIPFSISTPLRNVRLVEVPDDLAEIVGNSSRTGTNKTPLLKFKSALQPPSSSSRTSASRSISGPATSKESILHLCSDSKAWTVKQVSTSNSVYLLEPIAAQEPRDSLNGSRLQHDEAHNEDVQMDGMDDFSDPLADLSQTSSALTAVSQVGNFLELYPVNLDEATIEQAIIDILPIYHHPLPSAAEPDLDLQSSNDSKPPRTRNQLVDDIPAPDLLVQQVCAKLCVFSDPDNDEANRCQVPSTWSLLHVWTEITERCSINNVKLDGEISLIAILNLLSTSNESATAAIAEKMLEVDGLFDTLGLFHRDESDTARRRLRPREVCQFVAGLLLSAPSSQSSLDRPNSNVNDTDNPSSHQHHEHDHHRQKRLDSFIQEWTNLVPSSFVKLCTPDLLRTSGVTIISDTNNTNNTTNDDDDLNDANDTQFILLPHITSQQNILATSPAFTTSPSTPQIQTATQLASFIRSSSSTNEKSRHSLGEGHDPGISSITASKNDTSAGGARASQKSAPNTNTATASSTSTTTTTADRKRKWHEKFGAQRNNNLKR